MIPIRAGRWWHLVGLLSLTSGLTFLASIAAVLYLTFSQPPFHAPTTDPDPASAVRPGPTALTLTVPVAHGRAGETSALMERAARHRSWTIRPSGGGNRRTLELPTEDLPRLNSIHTGPEPVLRQLAEEPPPPPGAPRTTVQLDWELQAAPGAGLAAAALTPAFLVTLALGLVYIAGLPTPLLTRPSGTGKRPDRRFPPRTPGEHRPKPLPAPPHTAGGQMTEDADTQTAEDQIPWIHANVLMIEAKGLQLLSTPEQAQELSRRTGSTEDPSYRNPAPPLPARPADELAPRPQPLWQCNLHHLETSLTADATGSHISCQLHDHDGSLGEELERAARTLALAAEVSQDPGHLEELRIRISMNADRPPHGEADSGHHPPQMLQTENGLTFLYTLFWEPLEMDLDEEEDDDGPGTSYDVMASGLLAERQVPGTHDLTQVMQAIYAVAARSFFEPGQLDI